MTETNTPKNTEKCKLSVIDNAVNSIDSIDKTISAMLSTLEDMPQATVDSIIENKINPSINKTCNLFRDSLVKDLKSIYQKQNNEINKLKPIQETDLSALADPKKIKELVAFLIKLKDFICNSYLDLVTLMPKFVEHIDRLTQATNKLKQPRNSKTGKINFNKLKIEMKPITLSDITS